VQLVSRWRECWLAKAWVLRLLPYFPFLIDAALVLALLQGHQLWVHAQLAQVVLMGCSVLLAAQL